jgi:hypothetical protein
MMASHLFSVVLALGLLPATATPTLQTSSNSISGHVSNDQRMPLADLRVELLNEVDSVIRTVKTDGSGLFVFANCRTALFRSGCKHQVQIM